MGRVNRAFLPIALTTALVGTAVIPQQTSFPVFRPSVSIVSINREMLIENSRYGQATLDQVSKKRAELVAQNDTLTKALEHEELELTKLRKTLAAEEFTPLAEAFDVKVNKIRRTQGQKETQLLQQLETVRAQFFRQAEGVIAQMMQENRILFVLNAENVWLSQGGDITSAVIDRLDAAFSAGELTLELTGQ